MADLLINKKTHSNYSYMYFFSPFRHFFEDHIEWIKENRVVTHKIDPMQAHVHRYDFSSLLFDLQIPIHYHWFVMRINDMKYNHEFDEDRELLWLPDDNVLEELLAQYNTINAYSKR